jgi:hypothetical protein
LAIFLFRIDPSIGHIRRFVDAFAAQAAENGVPFLDLGPIIHRSDWFWRFRVNRADGHPNHRAHQLAAESLFDFIVRENLLENFRPQSNEGAPPRRQSNVRSVGVAES